METRSEGGGRITASLVCVSWFSLFFFNLDFRVLLPSSSSDGERARAGASAEEKKKRRVRWRTAEEWLIRTNTAKRLVWRSVEGGKIGDDFGDDVSHG